MLYEVFSDTQYKEDFVKTSYLYYLMNCLMIVLFMIFKFELIETVNRNHYIQYIFPLLILEYYIYLYYNNDLYKIIRFISIVIVVILSIIAGSVTGNVVVFIAYIYMYVLSRTNFSFKILYNWKLQFIFLCLFFILCVWLADKNPIPNIISRIFLRTDGFSGRTGIISLARNMIMNNILFGVGMRNFYDLGLIYFYGNVHNMFLQYLGYGGIVGLALLLLNIIYTYITLDKNCQNKSKPVWIVLFSLFLMRAMFEEVPLYHYYITVALLYYLNVSDFDYIYLKSIQNNNKI